MLIRFAVRASTWWALRSRPAYTPRIPGIASGELLHQVGGLPVRRPRTSTSVSMLATSGSSSSTALTWWKAPTTVDSGSIAAACWAADPSATGRAKAPCLSKPSGFTQSTTTLPAQHRAKLGEQLGMARPRARRPRPRRPAAAAATFAAPVTSRRSASARVAAASRRHARRSRLPITTVSPAAAQRRASPRPCGPVPPSTATVVPVRSLIDSPPSSADILHPADVAAGRGSPRDGVPETVTPDCPRAGT